MEFLSFVGRLRRSPLLLPTGDRPGALPETSTWRSLGRVWADSAAGFQPRCPGVLAAVMPGLEFCRPLSSPGP